jgi:hypothetical protein
VIHGSLRKSHWRIIHLDPQKIYMHHQ